MTARKKQILTVKNIRNINMENILQSVLRKGRVMRSDLARENNISLMTVKHIVDALIAEGILIEKESNGTDVGRKPKVLEIAGNYGNILCINLTSEHEIHFLIYDIFGELLENQTIPLAETVPYKEGLMEVLRTVKQIMDKLPMENVGIAVFVPSVYDEAADLVNYDLIAGFKNLHMKAIFKEEFGTENILILHDVVAAAKAEYDSPHPQMESQFYFYCGYGVGGCFIQGEEAVAGTENMAGEVGKMLVSMDGKEKDCKIVEDVISISAVKKILKDEKTEKTFAELLEAYLRGEEEAKELLAPVLNTVSKVLYNILWVYNPTKIVIDSCESNYSKALVSHFQNFMDVMEDDAIPIHAQVRQAKYDEYHSMKGCFHMVRNAWVEKIASSVQ